MHSGNIKSSSGWGCGGKTGKIGAGTKKSMPVRKPKAPKKRKLTFLEKAS